MNYLHRQLSRRTFLRAGAVTIGLPMLNAMLPLGLRAEQRAAFLHPKRLLLIGRVLGCNAEFLFPEKTGLDYEPTRYLKIIDRHRGKFTVFSGVSHLGYPNSHHTESGLFSGMPPDHIQRADDIHPTISLDQFVAERVGRETRFPCVLMGGGNQPMTFNRNGVPVPCAPRPEEIFKRLFLDGAPEAVTREVRRLKDGQSILDGVRQQFKGLSRSLGGEDRARLDLLATSIREAEQDLRQEQAWAGKSKPKVDRKLEDYRNPTWSSGQKMRYDLAFLAFQTDSSRVAVALEGEASAGDAPGTSLGQHDASHHGQDPKKIEQFALYEEEEMRNFGGLLVSDIVGRLGVKARAAGISLVFAAQRPDANVMPMQLRANLGNRLVLRVDGEGTSEIALGEKGAERLLGKGLKCGFDARLDDPPVSDSDKPISQVGRVPRVTSNVYK